MLFLFFNQESLPQKTSFNFNTVKHSQIKNTLDSPVGGLTSLCLPLNIEYGIYSVAQCVALEKF